MAYKSENYTPIKRNRELLARAWEHVQSVPYPVTLRWLFYRLLQEGWYTNKKSDYKDKFCKLMSAARHNFWEGWRPWTLTDDRRSPVMRGDGHLSPDAWVKAMRERVECKLARWAGQSWYVEIWFEADAMRSQFEHYTRDIVLRPFGGEPSIDYKWQAAKELERFAQLYAMAPKILYFGDYDDKGLQIAETAARDIAGWCSADFDFERVGLNEGDGERLGIPEATGKPGAYQWEALDDTQAGQIITEAVERYVDYDAMAKVEELESETTQSFRRFIAGFSVD